MSALELERVEDLLVQLRAELAERGSKPLPTLLKLEDAARELSVGMTKMRELVKRGVVLATREVGGWRVPRSEIERLAHVERPKVALTGKAARLASSLAKLREPVPVKEGLKLKVRDATRPRNLTGGTQDSGALRKRRR